MRINITDDEWDNLKNKLHSSISKEYRKFFVEDLENCYCSSEIFELSEGLDIVYISKNGICKYEKKYTDFDIKINIPLLENITNNDIKKLLDKACELSNNYNKKISLDLKNINHVFKNEKYNFLEAQGALIINLDFKIGAFCIINNITKGKFNNEI